jgi:hypothetical protein
MIETRFLFYLIIEKFSKAPACYQFSFTAKIFLPYLTFIWPGLLSAANPGYTMSKTADLTINQKHVVGRFLAEQI